MTQDQHKHLGQRRLPAWLALLLVLLFGGGAVWGILSQMNASPRAAETVAVDGPQRKARMKPQPAPTAEVNQVRPDHARASRRNGPRRNGRNG